MSAFAILFLLFNVYITEKNIYINILNEGPCEMEFAVLFKHRQLSAACNYTLLKIAKASITHCLPEPIFF